MKKYNISKLEKYTKDGAEKTYWANVGTMTEFEKQDGSISRIIEIPAISLKASIFEIKSKDEKSIWPDENPYKAKEEPVAKKGLVPLPDEIEYPEEEINPEDIPF